jgi:hypothetical protein
MHLILLALTMIYLWSYFKYSFSKLPEPVIHFILLPGLALGLYFLPVLVLTGLAACGIVLLADVLLRTPSKPSKPVKRSNIPPPP